MLRPLQWLAHVPGAYALLAKSTGSGRVRRSPLAYGMLTHRPIPDELTAAWTEPLRRPEIRADMVAFLKGIDKRDTLRAAEVLHERPVPALLAWAPDDLIFRLRYAERLRDMIPGARLETIADSRAFVPEDRPERLAELIAEVEAEAAASPGARTASLGAGAASPGAQAA